MDSINAEITFDQVLNSISTQERNDNAYFLTPNYWSANPAPIEPVKEKDSSISPIKSPKLNLTSKTLPSPTRLKEIVDSPTSNLNSDLNTVDVVPEIVKVESKYSKLQLPELKQKAKDLGAKNYSKLRKEDIIKLLDKLTI